MNDCTLPPRPEGYTPEEWASYHRDPCSWCAKELSNPDPGVRATAADILRGLGPDAEGAVPALIAALKDPDVGVRRAVAFAFIDIGYALKEKAASAIGPLHEMLTDPDTETRGLSASALGAIGPAAAACVPSLRLMLSDPAEEVRESAAEAL